MDVHVGRMETTVSAVDDYSPLTPEFLDAVTAAVETRLHAREAAEAARRDEAATWSSVRDGRTR